MGVMKIVLIALAGWGAIAIVMVVALMRAMKVERGGRVKSLDAKANSRWAVTRAIYPAGNEPEWPQR
jgi:hypothetical protein